MTYLYQIDFPVHKARQGMDIPFDPASVAKLFYATFLLSHFRLAELQRQRVRLRWRDMREHGSGTRKLRWWQVGRSFSLLDLLTNSLEFSCNISTGIIADFAGRSRVNEFVRQQGLKDTSVFSDATPNQTTVSDLNRLIDLIMQDNLLGRTEQGWLLDTMFRTNRRSVIKQVMGEKHLVASKGGTTFQGLRRDLGLLFDTDHQYLGKIIIVQETETTLKFGAVDRLLAKFHLGRLSRWLRECDGEFVGQVRLVLRDN